MADDYFRRVETPDSMLEVGQLVDESDDYQRQEAIRIATLSEEFFIIGRHGEDIEVAAIIMHPLCLELFRLKIDMCLQELKEALDATGE